MEVALIAPIIAIALIIGAIILRAAVSLYNKMAGRESQATQPSVGYSPNVPGGADSANPFAAPTTYGSAPPTQTVGIAASGAFNANANGVFTGTLTGLDVSNGQNTGSFTYYVVDTTRVIAIETDPNQLTLIDFSLHR